ncbi:MAG: enoyl-CoA hydratase/isomerase family protein [Rhodoferax sp.]|nr:enoyl-CoA hydratase/isomerase family protein [Rhodoferax sp.]
MEPTYPDWTGTRLSLHRQGGTAVVRLFNPPHGFMDEAMETELAYALDQLDAWPEGRVVVLTGGEPGMFVRHYDVAVLHQRAQAMLARGKTFSVERPVPQGGIHRCIERIDASPLVFIAAINGVAMGGGFELALGCDIRLAQKGDYQLGLPELNLGLLPGAGGTQAMAALLGTGRTLFHLLTAKVFNPDELLALGLVSSCTPDVLVDALRLAEQIEAVPARACANIKRLVRNAPRWGRAEGLAAERTLFCDCMVDPQAEPLMADVARGERTIADKPRRRPDAA